MTSLRIMLRTCLSFAVCLSFAAIAQAQDEDSAAYHRDINKSQAELDEGKIAAAKAKLDRTVKSLRSFEFEYLQARANGATESTAAPDLVQTVPKPDVEVRYGVLNEVNRQLAYICRDGSLRIYDLADLKSDPKKVGHSKNAAVWSGAFSRDGKAFFSGHENGEVLVWDAEKWELRHTVTISTDWAVRELAAAPDGQSFVAENKSELELWSLAEAEPKKVTGVGPRYTFGEGLAYSPKGDLIATGGMFDILLHDAKTGQQTKSMRHASYTMGLEFSPDGKRIASAPRGNVNRFLAVFDLTQDTPTFNAGPFGNYIAGMVFSPDGKRIAATGCEKVLRLFDSSTGEIALSIARPECGSKPAFTRDGRLLGWSEQDGYRIIELGKQK